MTTKKELTAAYKQLKPRVGIFQIKNNTNAKVFIESSTALATIGNRHRTQLNFGGHPNLELQKDWNTLGESQFEFSILEEIEILEQSAADYQKDLKVLEKLTMEHLQPYGERGYHTKPRL